VTLLAPVDSQARRCPPTTVFPALARLHSLSLSPPSQFSLFHPLTRRRYKKKVKDYNFGSLIRTDARQEYGEKNTIFGALSFALPCETK
jgi:hypothetical protein